MEAVNTHITQSNKIKHTFVIHRTDLYKYCPDAVPPIQYVSSHVAIDKDHS